MVNDADGRMLTAARSNGVDTSYSYDDAGRLTGVGHTGPAGAIDGFSYMLDTNGNRTAVMSNAGTETYTLDALNRLTNVTYPGALTETFAYDAAGNRTSHTKTDGTTVGYTVDATGQLTSDTSGTTYTYDAAGNLTSTSDGESYTYDDYGRHVSISAGGVTQTYGYDATNTRVTVDGQTQLWDRNGGLPTLISTSGGDNYVHTVGVSRDGDDWLLADAVGSVRTVVDNAGATTGSQSFTAFGEQLSGSGTFGFAGEQQDPTGLQHLRARQYNPALGRFTTVDPVQPGAPGTTGYNLYAYSGNNPTTWTDPSGRFVEASSTYSVVQKATFGVAALGVGLAVTLRILCLAEIRICEQISEIDDVTEPITDTAPPRSSPTTTTPVSPSTIVAPSTSAAPRTTTTTAPSDCIAEATSLSLALPAQTQAARRSGQKGRNVAAAVWCVNRFELGGEPPRESRLTDPSGHPETEIIDAFKANPAHPPGVEGVFFLHTNLKPCDTQKTSYTSMTCTGNILEFRGAYGPPAGSLAIRCTYFFKFNDKSAKVAYRDSFGAEGTSLPTPRNCFEDFE